jgi:lysyl-tRNA synthetase class 2
MVVKRLFDMCENKFVSETGNLTIEAAVFRAACLSKIREFFRIREVIEVETPLLFRGCSVDCHLDLFTSCYHPNGHIDSVESEQVFLHSSPEFGMKRLLAKGFPDIFQICKVFRNGEFGRIHNPEFTILEWYRRQFDMFELIEEVIELCSAITDSKTVKKWSYIQLFKDFTGIDPLKTNFSELADLCRSKSLTPITWETVTDALQFVMSEIIEPLLPDDTLCVVYNFPAQQAILSQLDETDSRLAKRFEVYYNKVELANGFQELTDPEENLRRLKEENRKRENLKKKPLPIDMKFIDALKSGMPPCSGVAMGVDRLIMLAGKYSKINDVISFAWEAI